LIPFPSLVLTANQHLQLQAAHQHITTLLRTVLQKVLHHREHSLHSSPCDTSQTTNKQ